MVAMQCSLEEVDSTYSWPISVLCPHRNSTECKVILKICLRLLKIKLNTVSVSTEILKEAPVLQMVQIYALDC